MITHISTVIWVVIAIRLFTLWFYNILCCFIIANEYVIRDYCNNEVKCCIVVYLWKDWGESNILIFIN